jgi:hypothetical protein
LSVRVPEYPPQVTRPINTLAQFWDGGYVLTSHCSLDASHEHVIDYDETIARFGDVALDHSLRTALTCPQCGAPGGGIAIRSNQSNDGLKAGSLSRTNIKASDAAGRLGPEFRRGRERISVATSQ